MQPSSAASFVSHRSQDSGATTNPGSPIEPDTSETNSARATELDDEKSSTRSLTQSILDYPMENGRRYHKYREGSYFYPNDELENERLDFQHEFLRIVHGGRLHLAPVKDPKKIMDIGTGTGIWPVEMAEDFPDAEIIGSDLSATQPDWVPDNVRFVIDDATEEDWLYPPESFDYIHTRLLLGCFEDFRDIIRKGFKYTKPGGWMECQEPMSMASCDDKTMPANWAFNEWSKMGDEAAMYHGKPLRIANKLKRWYEQAGFVDVHEEVFKIPMNPWPKDPHYKHLGRISEINWLQGVQAMCLAWFSRIHGWTKDEIEVYLVNVRKAVSDRSVHSYHKFYVVWGRKPEVGEDVPNKPQLQPSTARPRPAAPTPMAPPPVPGAATSRAPAPGLAAAASVPIPEHAQAPPAPEQSTQQNLPHR